MKKLLPTTPTFMDGVFVAVNAIPDVFLLIHGPNCGLDKINRIGLHHDLYSNLFNAAANHRADYSKISQTEMVVGEETKLRDALIKAIASGAYSLYLVLESSVTLLMGTDTRAVAQEVAQDYAVPIGVIPGNSLSGDFLSGYSAALECIAENMPLTVPSRKAETIGIAGFFMDRLEYDRIGDKRELTRMLQGLCEDCDLVWPDGTNLTQTAATARLCRSLMVLPHGARAAAILSRRLGISAVETGIPMGICGSADWIRTVASPLNKQRQAEDFIQSELQTISPRLEWAVRYAFAGRAAVVVSDPFIAPALSAFLIELGIHVSAVALHCRDIQLAQQAKLAISRHAPQARTIHDPDFSDIEDMFHEFANSTGPDGFIIGTGAERDAAKLLGTPYLETGFPSYTRHALYESPMVGFHGAACIADKIYNLLADNDYMRYPS